MVRWVADATQSAWREDQARAIPVPWRRLAKLIRPKGGNVGIVIAAPGVGKTTLLLNWVAKSNLKTLYLSMDTSPMDITAQMASMVTGHERVIVERRMMESEEWRRDYAQAIYGQVPNFVVDFSPSLSVDQIRAKAESMAELWCETPELIVIDTASNIAMRDMGENAEWQRVWMQTKELARELNSFAILAHHVKAGPVKSGRVQPELSDGLWGCEQFPEFVFGLHAPSNHELILSLLKNRGGVKNVSVHLDAQLQLAQINDRESVDGGATHTS
jgi:replicative DNA helicase